MISDDYDSRASTTHAWRPLHLTAGTRLYHCYFKPERTRGESCEVPRCAHTAPTSAPAPRSERRGARRATCGLRPTHRTRRAPSAAAAAAAWRAYPGTLGPHGSFGCSRLIWVLARRSSYGRARSSSRRPLGSSAARDRRACALQAHQSFCAGSRSAPAARAPCHRTP